MSRCAHITAFVLMCSLVVRSSQDRIFVGDVCQTQKGGIDTQYINGRAHSWILGIWSEIIALDEAIGWTPSFDESSDQYLRDIIAASESKEPSSLIEAGMHGIGSAGSSGSHLHVSRVRLRAAI